MGFVSGLYILMSGRLRKVRYIYVSTYLICLPLIDRGQIKDGHVGSIFEMHGVVHEKVERGGFTDGTAQEPRVFFLGSSFVLHSCISRSR